MKCRKYWAEINHLFVGFGQTICMAQTPACYNCNAYEWCPSRKITSK